MSKEFLQKPRYEYCNDNKDIVDTELDVLVDMDGVIDRLNTQCFQKKELLRNIRIKDQQIAELQKQLEEKTKTVEGLIEEQKNIENSASYQMFLDIQKQLEEKEKELLIEKTTKDRWYKREVKRRDDKISRQRQQLKSQPAEIMEKIYEYLTQEENWKQLRKAWLNNGECEYLRKSLDAILKAYQK